MNKTIRVSREALINMMSDKDHDTRIIAERQMLALLSQPAEQQDESWQAGYDKGRQDGANRRPDDVKQLELRNIELQSELNEARTSIAHLLIELDAVPKIPSASAMAKALSDKHADEAGVNRADTWKQYSQDYIEDVEYMLADAPHVSFTDEGKSGDDMRISLISDEKIGEVPCSEHPDAPHGFNRTASHTLDRYVCDCEGWVPPVADEGKA